ncbi:N-(5'phosphoribosyl)anthranilate isomerase [Pyrolobus fumarii 1A]|uniref:N-(5'-phosphoribosyl)anthranilate isomerase n=1 Tax=Pyrolobus fumarii (strain DSM 11204 / 1A) TaxID=694429 RepID=G0EH33_PYRF1|nr:phosphoribosylanthranilate isomerase [Pyrolobus fumarii]AEM38483.1 N-(5'phosphoribosyl)anthranilate isomerase [Pyrolobus fumarii 1A]
MAKVKVCGITRVEDVEMLDGLVDYLGFITGLRVSPRVLDPKMAADLASTVSRSTPVLVAYGLEPDEVVELAGKLGVFRVVQYHWFGKPRELASLARMLGDIGVRLAPVLFHGVGGWAPLHPLFYSRVSEAAEYTLIDAPKSSPARYDGGLRIPVEAVEEAARLVKRLGVAGGVNSDNVCLVARHAWLIDVSSGVEEKPGVKSKAAVEKLLEKLKECTG